MDLGEKEECYMKSRSKEKEKKKVKEREKIVERTNQITYVSLTFAFCRTLYEH
jgi:hypothetical protein